MHLSITASRVLLQLVFISSLKSDLFIFFFQLLYSCNYHYITGSTFKSLITKSLPGYKRGEKLLYLSVSDEEEENE